jgi:hypothetical protein
MTKPKVNLPASIKKREWTPHAGPQTMFLRNPAELIMYGGAKGGGKTDAGLIFCIKYWQHAGYKSILFRKTYKELELHVIPRSHELFGGIGSYDGRDHKWTFRTPDGGKSYLFFGYLMYETDVFAYSGAEFARMFFDESTFFCMTPETEVLTESGWKVIGQVTIGERVASLSKENEISFQPVEKVYAFPYEGELLNHFSRSGTSFRVTPNHRMVLRDGESWKFCKANKLPKAFNLVRRGRWTGHDWHSFDIPRVKGRGIGRNGNQVGIVDAADWFTFVGWYLSEGCAFVSTCRGKTRGPSTRAVVKISQRKRIPDLEMRLTRMGWRWSYTGTDYVIYSRQLYSVVSAWGRDLYEKRLPRWMLSASQRLLRFFFDAFSAGDGRQDPRWKENGGIQIGLANEGLIDDLQEVCVRLGFVATKGFQRIRPTFPTDKSRQKEYDVWRLSIALLREGSGVSRSKVKREPYSGDVYCLSVPPYGTFLTRHRGRTSWTGNSENMIRMMLANLRSPVAGIRRQAAMGANPIGPGFGYHKLMFVKGRQPNVIYHDARWPSDQRPAELSTCFIPARVWDNPTLLKRDPEYPRRLLTQYKAVTDALLYGSWENTVNLAIDWDELQHTCEPNIIIPEWAPRWIGIDWGKTDYAAAVWLANDSRRTYCYRNYGRRGKDIVPFAHDVVEHCYDRKGKKEAIACVVLSHECFADHGMGETQADQFTKVFQKAGIPVFRSDRDPVGRLTLLREYMRLTPLAVGEQRGVGDRTLDYNYWLEQFRTRGGKACEEYQRLMGPAAASEDLPKILIFRTSDDGVYGCENLIKTLPLLATELESPFKIADNQEDDFFDALTYGLKAHIKGEIPIENLYRERMARLSPDERPDSLLAQEITMETMKKELEAGDGEKVVDWQQDKFKG